MLLVFVSCVNRIDVTIHSSKVMEAQSFSCTPYSSSTDHGELGAGTAADPFLICSPHQLASLATTSADWKKHFKLMSDLDMADYDETNWTIIGNFTTPFRGVFDGNFHTISNFTYQDNSVDQVGLFGYVFGADALIKNLTLTNAAIEGNDNVGALIGYIRYGTVSNVHSSGVLTGDRYKGGLIGTADYGAIISSSSSSINITSQGVTDSTTGGLIGRGTDAIRIENCFATGDVGESGTELKTGNHGGLVGRLSDSLVINSYATGDVFSDADDAGGLIGDAASSDLVNVFATGNVTCNAPSSSNCGRLYGLVPSMVTNSFFSTDATCLNNGAMGSCNGSGSSGSHLAGYFYDKNNAPLSSWDFNDSWQVQASAFPLPNPTQFSESSWGTCQSHPASGHSFAGGKGTVESPFLICTKDEFLAIGSNIANWGHKHYKLMNDIDLTGITGTTYNIMGTVANPFSGSFDGNKKKIINLSYVSALADVVGLFGDTDYLLLKNLALINPVIFGRDSVGAVAGAPNDSTFINIYIEGGLISGDDEVGGFGGMVNDNRIRYVYSTASVSGDTKIGGLIGDAGNSLELSSSFAAGTVNSSSTNIGLLVGEETNGEAGLVNAEFDSNVSCTTCTHSKGTGIDVGGAAPSNYFYDQTSPVFTNDIPWDFDNIWLENSSGYPTFRQ